MIHLISWIIFRAYQLKYQRPQLNDYAYKFVIIRFITYMAGHLHTANIWYRTCLKANMLYLLIIIDFALN